MKSVFLYDKRITDQSILKIFSNDFTASDKSFSSCDVLLRWGNINGSDHDANIILNRKKTLMNSLDNEKSLEILRINKIRRPRFINPRPDSPYPLIAKHFDATSKDFKEHIVRSYPEALAAEADFFVEQIDLIKKYNVYIFNLKVFHLTKKMVVRTNSQKNKIRWVYEEVPIDMDHDSEKVCHLAQRAVYVLGLDFGMVHAGIDVRGRAVVLSVTPTPLIPENIQPLFYQKVKEFIAEHVIEDRHNQTMDGSAEKNPASEVLLGADPEFMLRDSTTGKIIYPSDYFTKEGPLGYDERSEQRQGILYPLAEVRPQPELCPLKLTENIYRILQTAASIIPSHIEWLAGSLQFENYQIGGHIHFSNVEFNADLLRALDNYLGIPVFLIEDPCTSAKRRRQYGWIGSFRIKPHGGFEYRTPGSWLVSAEITKGCLCLAKIVASEYRFLQRDYLVNPDLQKSFYQAKKLYFYDIFDELWEDITRTSLYSDYVSYLEPLSNIIKNRSCWNENDDFRKSWGILSDGSSHVIN